jgi:hypothetical protein
MVEDRRPLPESIGGLVQAAFRAYCRRFRLYFGAAVAGMIFQAVIAYERPGDDGFFYAGGVIVDSLLAALVTIGVIADLRDGERPTDRAVFGGALDRWGLVAAVTTLVDIITVMTMGSVFGPPEATAFGFLILPIVVFWGSVSFATVIAATDEKTSPLLLILGSLGRSVSLALARQNVGRLIALSLVAVLPMLVQTVLFDQLQLRKVAGSEFIANVPIDALVTGPLQAVFTLFYLDFVRRAGQRPS